MKYSQFNSIILYDDNYILFNTFSKKMIAIEPTLKELVEAAKREGIDNLEDIHPSFFDALKRNEFIIEDNINEVEKVRELRNMVDYNDQFYHLTINPTMNCNFKCWYCYETHIKASRMNEGIIRRVNKFLDNQIRSKQGLKYFNLAWFGGEPLLYFHDIVLPIIKHFNGLCKEASIINHISFTSNGFLINPKMITLFKSNNVGSLQITLDGYKEDHDQVRFVSANRGSYEKIIENVILLIRGEISVLLRFNYTVQNIRKIDGVIEDIACLSENERKYLLIDFHRVWQDNAPLDNEFVESKMDLFRAEGFNVKSNLLMDNVRLSCYADKKNSAVINYNGDVFKCTARDFTKQNREGYIDENGEIIWENDNLQNRMDIKFKNRPCLSCKLLPVCNGGCSQHAIEHIAKNEEYCLFDYDEAKKDVVVLQLIKDLLEK